MILPPAFIAAQIKPAFSPRKAEAIRRLNKEFGLNYKHICKLVNITEETFYRITTRKGAYK